MILQSVSVTLSVMKMSMISIDVKHKYHKCYSVYCCLQMKAILNSSYRLVKKSVSRCKDPICNNPRLKLLVQSFNLQVGKMTRISSNFLQYKTQIDKLKSKLRTFNSLLFQQDQKVSVELHFTEGIYKPTYMGTYLLGMDAVGLFKAGSQKLI